MYAALVTAPKRKEIYTGTDPETKEKILIDLRTPEQKVIANEVIENMIPYLRRQARQVLYSYVKINGSAVSRHSSRKQFSANDILGIGGIGIMKALGKYIPCSGSQFLTSCTGRINSEISRYLAQNQGMIRLSVEMHLKASKVVNSDFPLRDKGTNHDSKYNVRNQLAALINVQRGDEETASAIANGIAFALTGSYREINSRVGSSRWLTYADLIPDKNPVSNIENAAIAAEARRKLGGILATLTPREEYVLASRLYDDKTLQEIGDELNLTKERIRQLEREALKKVRLQIELRGLEELL